MHLDDAVGRIVAALGKLAGYQPPDDRMDDLKCDGEDIWPILSGEVAQPEPRVLYWLGPGGRAAAVREGDWKLVVHRGQPDDKIELFDLACDAVEQHDRASEQPERVARLQHLLAAQAVRDSDAEAWQ